MTPRRRRIERILEHRQKELDDRVAVLAAVKAREAAAIAEAEAADLRTKEAAEARRSLGTRGADVMTFMEAEEWLVSSSGRATRAWSAVDAIRREVETAQGIVIAVRTKLKQAEQLAARVELTERKTEGRRERRRDDEAAARITQQRAVVAGKR